MPIRAYVDSDLESVLDVWFQASSGAHSFLPDDFFEGERHDIATRRVPVAETILSRETTASTGSCP